MAYNYNFLQFKYPRKTNNCFYDHFANTRIMVCDFIADSKNRKTNDLNIHARNYINIHLIYTETLALFLVLGALQREK